MRHYRIFCGKLKICEVSFLEKETFIFISILMVLSKIQHVSKTKGFYIPTVACKHIKTHVFRSTAAEEE